MYCVPYGPLEKSEFIGKIGIFWTSFWIFLSDFSYTMRNPKYKVCFGKCGGA
tara:strand:+ start:492 stop:647 length:156 start_codon:yes stop_codon:yes gene_type:complete